MPMIQVIRWAGEKKAGVKFYSNTPGDQIIALMDTEEWVGTNPFRCAHITLTDTNQGLYIVRHDDEIKDPIWNSRLDTLRENLAKQERGFAVINSAR